MNIGSNPNTQAASQLMQATNQVSQTSNRQLQAVTNSINDAKATALQNSAQQASAAVERKNNQIDVMA